MSSIGRTETIRLTNQQPQQQIILGPNGNQRTVSRAYAVLPNNEQPTRYVYKTTPGQTKFILQDSKISPMTSLVPANNNPYQQKIIIRQQAKHIDKDNISILSNTSITSNDKAKHSKKILGLFHPYYNEETNTLALQCCTCCIGCWRKCSLRCTGCESFLSCPIYCWLLFIFPLFLLMCGGVIVSALYAADIVQG